LGAVLSEYGLFRILGFRSPEMIVKLNGQSRDVPADTTLSDLLSELRILPERVAVELNFNIIDRDSLQRVRLKEGDSIEIIGFVGGGSC